MKKINNYSISEQIYEDNRSLIYRGHRSSDKRDRVVLKILNREYRKGTIREHIKNKKYSVDISIVVISGN